MWLNGASDVKMFETKVVDTHEWKVFLVTAARVEKTLAGGDNIVI